jgi:hypothetical protein
VIRRRSKASGRGVAPSTGGPGAPGPDGAAALERLREASDAILALVDRELAGWVVRETERIADAWGRLEEPVRRRVATEAETAGVAARDRVLAELRALFALEPAAQAATPLEIVRTAYREPTVVLAAAGVSPVERDEFDRRSWPDDRYALVPRTLDALRSTPGGDDDGEAWLQLAWGMAKAAALRSGARPLTPPGPAT